tara:strand:- start:235 stop:480 length:246 start_codon:yes stop_codon:yes gene_type:complete
MGKGGKLLRDMRNNPRDRRIDDVLTIARRFGIEVRNPRGSHVVLFHGAVADILSIPARKPVKPVYIRKLVDMIDRIEGKDE